MKLEEPLLTSNVTTVEPGRTLDQTIRKEIERDRAPQSCKLFPETERRGAPVHQARPSRRTFARRKTHEIKADHDRIDPTQGPIFVCDNSLRNRR